MEKCKGVTRAGNPCRSNAKENGFCRSHQKQYVPKTLTEKDIDKVVEVLAPSPEIQTTTLQPENRVLRHSKNPPCPNCRAHPTVCSIRRKDYSSHRCRMCGHRFEIDGRVSDELKEYPPGKEGNILFKRFRVL